MYGVSVVVCLCCVCVCVCVYVGVVWAVCEGCVSGCCRRSGWYRGGRMGCL